MLVQNTLILSFASLTIANPKALQVFQASPLQVFQAAAPLDAATSASRLLSILSDLPTLASSVLSVIETAIPSSLLTATDDAALDCATTLPGWYSSLPADVKCDISKYGDELVSWYSKFSSDLGAETTFGVGGGFAALCTTTSASAGGIATATGTPTATGSASGPSVAATSSSKAAGATGVSTIGVVGVVGVAGLLGAIVGL